MTLATAAVTGLFTAGLVMVPEAASAAVTCEEGERSSAAAMASEGGITEPVHPVYGDNAAVKLRYSEAHGCAWGWVGGPNEDVEVWLDRSFDDGQTWEPQLAKRNIQSGDENTYTAPFRVGSSSSVRACGQGWHSSFVEVIDDSSERFIDPGGVEFAPLPPFVRPGVPRPARPGGTKYKVVEEIVPGPVVCTAWFPRVPGEEDCDTVDTGVPGAAESGLPVRPLCALPDEAAPVLEQIDSGEPFDSNKDGGTWKNREGWLPERELGYYAEYTVPTPGTPDRWKRRLVVGKDGEVYFTDDHYGSFAVVDAKATGSA